MENLSYFLIKDQPSEVEPKSIPSIQQDISPWEQSVGRTVRRLTFDPDQFYINQIGELIKEIKALNKSLNEYNTEATHIVSHYIYNIPDDSWELKRPLQIILKIYNEEVLALLPELEIYGDGKTESEAINNLKLEFIDLLYDLNELNNNELGVAPKMWKKTLLQMVKNVDK